MKMRHALLILVPLLSLSIEAQAAPKVDTSRCAWLDHWTGTSQFQHGKAAIRDGKTLMHLGEVYSLKDDGLAHLSTTCGQPVLAKTFSGMTVGIGAGRKVGAAFTILGAGALGGAAYCGLKPEACGVVQPKPCRDDDWECDDSPAENTPALVLGVGGGLGVVYGGVGWGGGFNSGKKKAPWTVRADNAAKYLHQAVVDFQVAAKSERETAQTSWNACQVTGSDEGSHKAQADACGTYARLIANGGQTRKIGSPAPMQVSGLAPWLKDLAVNHDEAQKTEVKAFASYMEAAFNDGRRQCRSYPSGETEAAAARDACERGIKVLQEWGTRSDKGAWASVAPDAFKAGEAFVAKAEDRTGSMMTGWKRLKEAARPKPKPKPKSSYTPSRSSGSSKKCSVSMVNGRYCCPSSYAYERFNDGQRAWIRATRRSPTRQVFQALLNKNGCWRG